MKINQPKIETNPVHEILIAVKKYQYKIERIIEKRNTRHKKRLWDRRHGNRSRRTNTINTTLWGWYSRADKKNEWIEFQMAETTRSDKLNNEERQELHKPTTFKQ